MTPSLINSQVPARDHTGYYTHPFKPISVPSVTTRLGVLNKPALAPSAAKLTATFAYDTAGQWLDLDRQAAIDHIKSQYRREWDHKKWRGSAVHKAVELEILGEPIPDTIEITEANGQVVAAFNKAIIAPYLVQWHEFLDIYRPEFEAVEFEVWSERYAYAGKGDCLGRLCGGRWYFDIKTGDSGIWPESALQLSAYVHGDYILDRRTGTETPLGDLDGAFCLHLQPKYFSVVRVDTSEETFRTFLYLSEVWHWNREKAKGSIGLPMPTPEVAA